MPLETITHHPTLEPISILNSFWKFHITDLFQKIFVSPSFAEKTWYYSWIFHWNCKYPVNCMWIISRLWYNSEGVMVLWQNLDYLLYPPSLEICAEILCLKQNTFFAIPKDNSMPAMIFLHVCDKIWDFLFYKFVFFHFCWALSSVILHWPSFA